MLSQEQTECEKQPLSSVTAGVSGNLQIRIWVCYLWVAWAATLRDMTSEWNKIKQNKRNSLLHTLYVSACDVYDHGWEFTLGTPVMFPLNHAAASQATPAEREVLIIWWNTRWCLLGEVWWMVLQGGWLDGWGGFSQQTAEQPRSLCFKHFTLCSHDFVNLKW